MGEKKDDTIKRVAFFDQIGFGLAETQSIAISICEDALLWDVLR